MISFETIWRQNIKLKLLLFLAIILLSASVIISLYKTRSERTEVLTELLQLRQHDFEKKNADLIYQFRRLNFKEVVARANADNIFFYAYAKDSLNPFIWTSKAILPSEAIISSSAENGITQLSNGYYSWNKQVLKDTILIGMILVKSDYVVTNRYLSNSFYKEGFLFDKIQILAPGEEKFSIRSLNGKEMYSLSRDVSEGTIIPDKTILWLYLTGLVLLGVYLNYFIVDRLERGKDLWTNIWKVSLLMGVITILRYMNIPHLHHIDIFNSSKYYSDPLNRSLGDLLINSGVFLWITALAFHGVFYVKRSETLPSKDRWPMLIMAGFMLVFLLFYISRIFSDLIFSNGISFDFLYFSQVDYSFGIALFCIAMHSMAFFFLTSIVVVALKGAFNDIFYTVYLVIAVQGLLILTFFPERDRLFELLWMIPWLVLFIYLLQLEKLRRWVSKLLPSIVIFWMLFFALSLTILISYISESKARQEELITSKYLSNRADISNDQQVTTLFSDYSIPMLMRMMNYNNNASAQKHLLDSIAGSKIEGYANHFYISLFFYDSLKQPVYLERNDIDFDQLNFIYEQESVKSPNSTLYVYSFENNTYGYIQKVLVQNDTGAVLGTAFLLANSSNTFSGLYPEVFSKEIHSNLFYKPQYAFGVYRNRHLVFKQNDYNFKTLSPDYYFAGKPYLLFKNDGFKELWYNAGNGYQVLTVEKERSVIKSITLFSYFLLSYLILSGIYLVIHSLSQSQFRIKEWLGKIRFSIRNQIHATILLITVFSFIIVGVTTIMVFRERYKNNYKNQLSNTLQTVEQDLLSQISNSQVAHSNSIEQFIQNPEFNAYLNKLSGIYNLPINIYDCNGDMVESTLPLPFKTGIISKKMDPNAWAAFVHDKYTQFYQDEQIGNLHYLSLYIPVFNQDKSIIGFLNIPYFGFNKKLQQEMSVFIVTLINLNAFIFLLAGIIALFITGRITQSFQMIGAKMNKINLTNTNEPIEWEGQDEIGELIRHYNNMVLQLDNSISAFALAEREAAWKLMARQVAHEIKNPLTPMKLNIQFLQKAIQEGHADVTALTERISKSMIMQIEHLNSIAESFSEFANIDNVPTYTVNMGDVLRQIEMLYSSNTQVEFDWNIPIHPIYVLGNETQLNRLVTNLINNSLQSIHVGQHGKINLSCYEYNDFVHVIVSDNGIGIPENIRENIFAPNFTTKSSGAGLGLAMCLRIIQKMNGSIYFESVVGDGTTFHVEIPKIKDTPFK